MKNVFCFFLFILSINSFGQFAYPYKVYSENGIFFVKSIPFTNELSTLLGKSIISETSDSSRILFTIPRYFKPDHLFISNTGKTVCFIHDSYYPIPKLWDRNVIYFYQDGKQIQTYTIDQFIDSSLTKRIYSLLLQSKKIFEIEDESTGTLATQADKKSKDSIEEFVHINNPFVYNNLIYIFTQNKFVNVFNLENGNLLLKQSIKDFFKNNLIYPKPVKIERIKIKIPNDDRFPKLSNGLNYQQIFAEKMGFTHILNVEYEDFQKYRVYYFKVECSIDSSGHIGDIQVSSPDIKLKNKMFEFLSNSNFDTSLIPKGIEKWYFKDVPTFRNKTEEIAIKEREQDRASEKIKLNDRPASDSIDGIYIPIDLEDCFHQLDRILSMTDKEEFRKMSERDALAHYHFSLGLWIRNNWGLWSKSRLQIYFKKIGVKNPDAMSGMILTSYHRFLNKKEIQIDKQIRIIIDAHEKN